LNREKELKWRAHDLKDKGASHGPRHMFFSKTQKLLKIVLGFMVTKHMFFSFFLLGPLLFSKLLNFSLLGHFK
jgi:hypothetical protein